MTDYGRRARLYEKQNSECAEIISSNPDLYPGLPQIWAAAAGRASSELRKIEPTGQMALDLEAA